jgi:hypothetical protein
VNKTKQLWGLKQRDPKNKFFFLIVKYNYARSNARRSTKSSDYQEQNNKTKEKKKFNELLGLNTSVSL